MFVINFVYDTPGGLEETIIQVMKVDSTQYTLLYSLYSWPAIVTALLSGVIIDRFLGLGTEIVIVVVLATVGLIIIDLGCFINTYWLMLLGCFVLGIGAEAAVLATSSKFGLSICTNLANVANMLSYVIPIVVIYLWLND